jgi:hypothetical protein
MARGCHCAASPARQSGVSHGSNGAAVASRLTAAARVGIGSAGRDDGMAVLIEQQDDFWSGPLTMPIGSVGVRAAQVDRCSMVSSPSSSRRPARCSRSRSCS